MNYLSFDIETTDLNIWYCELQMCSWDDNGKIGYWVKGTPFPKDIERKLKDERVLKIVHSFQFDGPVFRQKTGIHIRNVHDTEVNEQVILGGRGNPWKDSGLAVTLQRRFGIHLEKETRDSFIGYKGPITQKQIKYGVGDIKHLYRLYKAQLKDIEEMELETVSNLENRTVEVTAEMRYNGIQFDEQFWIDLAEENTREYEKLIKKLPKCVKNWGSEKQVKKYFKDKHGIVIETYDEFPDVKNKELDTFKEARQYYKAVTSYGLGFLNRNKKKGKAAAYLSVVDPDGRIRPGYNQIVDTGRYSMSKPTLHNIPAKRKGRHRLAFIAKKGCKLVNGDFTGQELGIIAIGSGEQSWIQAMLKGHDVHSVMAEKIYSDWHQAGSKGCKFPFKCECPKHTERRRPAKDLNFGLAYGKGVVAFARDMELTKSEAFGIVRKYKRTIPRVTSWLESNGTFAVKNGYSKTLPPFNRIRFLLGEDWKVRNQGKNSPIQGSGADMMKLAMCLMYEYIYKHRLQDKIKMVMTLHDEVLTECVNASTKNWRLKMKELMEEAAMVITKLRVITTEPEIMERWQPK
jgi:DNA polymerase-1